MDLPSMGFYTWQPSMWSGDIVLQLSQNVEQDVEDKTLGYFKGCLTVRRPEFLSRESRTRVDEESSCGHAKQWSRYTISPRNKLHWFIPDRVLTTLGKWVLRGGGNTSVASQAKGWRISAHGWIVHVSKRNIGVKLHVKLQYFDRTSQRRSRRQAVWTTEKASSEIWLLWTQVSGNKAEIQAEGLRALNNRARVLINLV